MNVDLKTEIMRITNQVYPGAYKETAVSNRQKNIDHQEAMRMRFHFSEVSRESGEVEVELGSLTMTSGYFSDCKATVAKELRTIKRALDSHDALVKALRECHQVLADGMESDAEAVADAEESARKALALATK